MSTGVYLRVGDATSCGGEILEGDPGWLMEGRPAARAGDAVTCGASGQVYQVMGGDMSMMLNGRPAAGTLDSVSGCPCEASLIPSSLGAVYKRSSGPVRTYVVEPPQLAPIPNLEWLRSGQISFDQSGPEDTGAPLLEAQEPGFYVVPESTTYEAVEAELFSSPTRGTLDKFRGLHPRRGQVKAGEIMVLSDPSNLRCRHEETLLMELAAQIQGHMADVPPEVADFTAENHQVIQNFLGHASTGIGVGEAMIGQHFKSIERVIKEIEQLHVKTFLMHRGLGSADFLAERRKLFARLNVQMTYLTRKGIGFPDHPKLKAALGLSSRSLAHHWTKAGAPGQIPGYATHYQGISKAGKYLKGAGFIGIAIGAGASYMKVREVCRAGETEECKRVRVTEAGGFTFALSFGAAGSHIGLGASGPICIALGLSTAGVGMVICAATVAGAGALGGGMLGGLGGEWLADLIYGEEP